MIAVANKNQQGPCTCVNSSGQLGTKTRNEIPPERAEKINNKETCKAIGGIKNTSSQAH